MKPFYKCPTCDKALTVADLNGGLCTSCGSTTLDPTKAEASR